MNTTSRPESAPAGAATEPARLFRPRLSFYHANSKGSGTAARFEMIPAAGNREGAVFATLAPQKTIAAGKRGESGRRHATFDWDNKITVKLNFYDLCQMIPVFKGESDSVAGGKGLYHDSRASSTIINLSRQTEPFPGCVLDVSRRAKETPDNRERLRILFNDAESYGLGVVLEQILSLLAFGIPTAGYYAEEA